MADIVDDVGLAWELAASACPFLDRVQNDDIYLQIGIGETFDAIEALVNALVLHQIPISDALAATTARWLEGFRGQDAELRLRQVLARLNTQPRQKQMPSPTTKHAPEEEVA
ncbi:hypothetical protein [Mycolicibacterium monacense]|uniref:hypothetical protein n=1 Tax=Mycolicibacterium monacense TaxID=85693 RepID=UPI0010547222|nr:hypothetical protein [Mycolicibacterium monacense]